MKLRPGWLAAIFMAAAILLIGCSAHHQAHGGASGTDDDSAADDDVVADDDSIIDYDIPDAPPCPTVTDEPETRINVDPSGFGRVFDGVGAISSAGNSRYLIEYPEPQRSQILDYLFKPGYGAAIQILKVEIGGDMNSTSGSDASHMHDAADMNCDRSYEWWLMEEAKARNPKIRLAAIAWGAPGWIGNGHYWSQDSIDYLVAWLECAKSHGLTIDYLGGRNEPPVWSKEWFLLLQAALADHGFSTRIVAADTHSDFRWIFPQTLAGDPDFAAAVDVVGVHYPCYYDDNDAMSCAAPIEVIQLGLPIWASEEGGNPAQYGRILTRGYIEARLTGYINWPLMSSLPEGVPFQDSGLLVASQPWSGAYSLNPVLWAFAHMTKFTAPGWKYVDQAVGFLANDRTQGGYATLVSPEGTRATAILETSTATQDQVVEFTFADSMPARTLHLWVSDTSSGDQGDYLVHECDIYRGTNPIRLTLAPHRLYTLTSTRGQVRGNGVGPDKAVFPLPYENDFEGDTPGREAHLVANQNGAFEVAPCGGGRAGQCIRQMASKPIFWGPQTSDPFAIVGDSHMADYTVSVDAMPEQAGAIEVLGRYGSQAYFNPRLNNGYSIRVDTSGAWSILRYDDSTETPVTLASGQIAAWPLGTWRSIELSLQGSQIRAAIDGIDLATVIDGAYSAGLAGIGLHGGILTGGWFPAEFDNLSITPETGKAAGR